MERNAIGLATIEAAAFKSVLDCLKTVADNGWAENRDIMSIEYAPYIVA